MTLIFFFVRQTNEINKEVAASTESLSTSKTEITDLRRTMQGLEIELQSQLSMVNDHNIDQIFTFLCPLHALSVPSLAR